MAADLPSSRPPLVRFLSKCNVATRNEARELVRAGRIEVNGRTCRDGARRVDPGRDRVTLDGAPVRLPAAQEIAWIALNKPRGVLVTTRDPQGRRNVMDLLPQPHPPGLAPVGRLDQASAGLLLLTNDAPAAARLLDPDSHVAKVYRVKVRGRPDEGTLHGWRTQALEADGLVLGPMEVAVEREGPANAWLRVTLREGRNRQIRRRMEAAGHAVEHLIRVAFGSIELGDLAPGAFRVLDASEVRGLVASVR